RERDRVQSIPVAPGLLEALHQRSLGPPARIEHLVDQVVQASAIPFVKADRELGEVGRSRRGGGHISRDEACRGRWSLRSGPRNLVREPCITTPDPLAAILSVRARR